jgi:hypothetical protein
MGAVFFVVTTTLYFAATVSFLAYLLKPSETLSNVSLGCDGYWVCRPHARIGCTDERGD